MLAPAPPVVALAPDVLGDLGSLAQGLVVLIGAVLSLWAWARRRARNRAVRRAREHARVELGQPLRKHDNEVIVDPSVVKAEVAGEFLVSRASRPVTVPVMVAALRCTTADEVRQRWASNTSGPIKALVGAEPDGSLVEVDLEREGPCGIVVGSSGAGKTHLLTTMVIQLVTTYPPARLRLHLIDLRGGLTWFPLRSLPHARRYEVGPNDEGLLAELHDALADKSTALTARGVADASTYNARSPQSELPPFDLVIVDDGGAAGTVLLERLADLQRRYRLTGMGLIVAIQAPTRLPPSLLAMSRFSAILRVPDEGDRDLLAPRPLLDHLANAGRGRGLLLRSEYDYRPFQVVPLGSEADRSLDPGRLNILQEIVNTVRTANQS